MAWERSRKWPRHLGPCHKRVRSERSSTLQPSRSHWGHLESVPEDGISLPFFFSVTDLPINNFFLKIISKYKTSTSILLQSAGKPKSNYSSQFPALRDPGNSHGGPCHPKQEDRTEFPTPSQAWTTVNIWEANWWMGTSYFSLSHQISKLDFPLLNSS